jgi:hypothetical protein
MDRHRLKSAVLMLAIAAWFLGHTWKGLAVYFQEDDLMNMYQAWVLPLYKLVLANLTPFTSVYRPLGAGFYRLLYHSAGLHPLPFRIVAYGLMMLNVWLIFRLARFLTGSTEIAILSALLGSFHNRLMDIYLNDGTIYDVLCSVFYYLSLCYYISARAKYGALSWRRLAILCAFYTLALNSKEMACTLPVVLLAYEWIFHRTPLYRQHAVWTTAIITAVAIKMKTGPSSSFAGVPDYALHFSLHQFLHTTKLFLDQLFFLPEGSLNTTKVIAILAALWAIALVTRQKPLLLCAALITLSPLPVNFITYRGFFVMYLPLAGWAIYLSSLLVAAREWLWNTVWKRPPLPKNTWEPERVGLFLIAAYVLFNIQSHDSYRSFDRIDPSQARIRALKEDLLRVRPSLAGNGKVLFLRDGFQPEDWDPLYIVRLAYRDPGIVVDRAKNMRAPLRPGEYNLVLDYCGQRYTMGACQPGAQ